MIDRQIRFSHQWRRAKNKFRVAGVDPTLPNPDNLACLSKAKIQLGLRTQTNEVFDHVKYNKIHGLKVMKFKNFAPPRAPVA